MRNIFVNLKRFDVSRTLGGVCPMDSPGDWIEGVVSQCADLGLFSRSDAALTFFLPQSLLIPAARRLAALDPCATTGVTLGCQGVYREDIRPGGNFGAFTGNLPATAARASGCSWALIGHSEERKDKLGVLAEYDPSVCSAGKAGKAGADAINRLVNRETLRALEAGLDVVVCVGETAEERGQGDPGEQKARVEAVLRRQVELSLGGVGAHLATRRVVVAYEPIWAIGPGKTPPGAESIAIVANCLKNICHGLFGQALPVVYGGGLKEENAAQICSLPGVDGGLVALTRFTGEIGFYPGDLQRIVAAATASARSA